MDHPAPREQAEPCKRLFFALSCSEAQRTAIAQWRRELGLRYGRPVASENFHLTLMFLGAVPLSQIATVCTAAASVRASGELLTVALDRLDRWRRANILLLAPKQEPLALQQLVSNLQQALLPLALVSAPKAFRPHLTLARGYRVEVPESKTPPDFQLSCRHFTLFESHQGRYRPVAEWPLTP